MTRTTDSLTDAESLDPHDRAGTARVTQQPSIHVRVVLTWLAIFPLVSLGLLCLAPFASSWHPILSSLILTIVVVPLSVYLVVPLYLRAYTALRHRLRRGRQSRTQTACDSSAASQSSSTSLS